MLEGFVDVTVILGSGVYALERDGVVVYIGQSKKMLGRISAHKSNWGKKSVPDWMPASCRGMLFDKVHVLPCRVEDLDRVERALIDLYKPKHNIHHKRPTPTETPMAITVRGITVPLNSPRPEIKFERRI